MNNLFLTKGGRCIPFIMASDGLILVLSAFVLELAPVMAAFTLTFFLVFITSLGISMHSAVLIVPHIFVKFILLLLMIFAGCVTVDLFNMTVAKHDKIQILSPSALAWKTILHDHPSLPIWLVLFSCLIAIELRLLFETWYNIVFTQVQTTTEKPPSYGNCAQLASTTLEEESPPTYEEYLRKASVQSTTIDIEGPERSRPSTSNDDRVSVVMHPISEGNSTLPSKSLFYVYPLPTKPV